MKEFYLRKVVATGATSLIALPLLKKLINNGDFVYAVIRPASVCKNVKAEFIICRQSDSAVKRLCD